MVIHSDNWREFINKVMEKLMAKLEVFHTTTPSYNPQFNNVEGFHGTLRTHYRMWTARHSMDWAKQLSALELAYNSKQLAPHQRREKKPPALARAPPRPSRIERPPPGPLAPARVVQDRAPLPVKLIQDQDYQIHQLQGTIQPRPNPRD